jgi:imidazolonepropionase-like amidohydrolase
MTVVYRAARVFDGHAMSRSPGRRIVVEGERVVDVVDDRGPAREIVDLGDSTVLPGLVDAHVHLVWDGSVAPESVVAAESAVRTAFRAAHHAAVHLRAGVVAVRDLGSTGALAAEVASAVDAGLTPGPHVVAAGRAIMMTGGHVHCIGREADGVDAVRHAVRAEVKAGAACIKLMASGGVLGPPGESPGAVQLTTPELAVAVEEAHRAGRRVAAHAHSAESIGNALDAGADSIEHGSRLYGATAERMAEGGVYLVPTLSPLRSICRNGPALGMPAEVLRKATDLLDLTAESFRTALAHGVPLAAGTDAGVPTQGHGLLWRELATMVELGCPLERALRAATAGGAHLLGLGDAAGRIVPGARADLVAVPGDPRDDIGVLGRPSLVLRGGIPIVEDSPRAPGTPLAAKKEAS